MNLTRCNNGHFYDKDKFDHCPHCASAGMGGGESGSTVPLTGMGEGTMAECGGGDVTAPLGGKNDFYMPQGGGRSDATEPVFADPVGGHRNGDIHGRFPEDYTSDTAETQPLTGAQEGMGQVNYGGRGAGGGQSYQSTSPVNIERRPIDPQVTTVGLDMDEKTVGFFHLNNPKIAVEPVVGWLVCVRGKDFGRSFNLKSGRNFIGPDSSMDVSIPGDKSISRQCHAVILYDPKSKMFLVQPGTSRELFYLNDKVVLGVEEIAPYQILTIGNTDLMFVPCCCEQFNWEDQIEKNKKEEEEK